MSDGACCSHLHVSYRVETLPGGSCRGWWACDDCDHKFWPAEGAPLPAPSPPRTAFQQAFEAEIELREICGRLRECVIKHGLGLGGEKLDELVINAYESHLEHVGQFLNDMYATMIDPCEQPKMKVAEMCALLLKTAVDQREREHGAPVEPEIIRQWRDPKVAWLSPWHKEILAYIDGLKGKP